MPTIHALLCRQVARYATRPLLDYPGRLADAWHEPLEGISYAAALARVEALRARYAAAGYGGGHRIALLLENRPLHYLHFLALNALGASVVPINPDYRAAETAYLLEHSEATLVVVLPERIADLRAVAATLARRPAVIDGTATPFDPPPSPAAPDTSAPDASTEAALLYTSGTTGLPKGCRLTNDYFIGFADWYASEGGYISLRPGAERLLQPLPTFHINGMAHSFMGMLGSGGCLVRLDRFHPRLWWHDARETAATCFHYLGVMPAMLLGLPPSPDDRAHALRFGLGGGVDPAQHAAFEDRFGTRLLEGWAMTETGAGGLLLAGTEPRHVGQRCLGRCPPVMAIRIVDDSGADLPDGIAGEALVCGAGADPRRHFCAGYLKDAAATDALWAGGWLHTGDLMLRTQDGCLHFIDRKKHIVRRAGENIAALEVEMVLQRCPLVAQAAVIAAPDPVRIEEVMACVVPAAGTPANAATARAIFEWCFATLAYFKAPGWIALVDALPTTSTQKVRKTELAELGLDPATHPNLHDFRALKRRDGSVAGR
jgi:acyl-CoA synthetase (AMP-forming)/AMP-acid ligase II